MKLKMKILIPLLLITFGFLTRFIFIWQPAEVVFDEVHYGKFANAYLKGEYFFSGHPPLGIQLIALGGWIGGYRPHFKFEKIGEKFSDFSYIVLRFMPALAGSLIPLAVYLLLISLGISRRVAFFAGVFTVLDNALISHSHFILIDSFLILFGILGLFFFFSARAKNYNLPPLLLASLFFSLSFSVKWAGLSFIALAGLVAFFDLVKEFIKKKFRFAIKKFIKFFFCLVILPIMIYMVVFYVHFKLLPKSGPGDIFMTQEFLKGEKGFIEKFIELNKKSYESNIKYLTARHTYASKFFTWPFMLRPILYWISKSARIYFIGNPIIWWLSTLAIFLSIGFLLIGRLWRERGVIMLVAGYFLNLLPYISIKRVLFLYHYLSALIFAIMILAVLINRKKHASKIFFGLVIIALLSFLYFAPFSYGLELTPQQIENHLWLKTWE